MSSSSKTAWDSVALLTEPTRRRVFELVRAAQRPLTREEVAEHAGIGRRLAAFHLDALAEVGLLTVDYTRANGRSGPGAGRPAKRYQAAEVQVELSVPPRRYGTVARILAVAISEAPGSAHERALRVARREGAVLGRAYRVPGRKSRASALAEASTVLAQFGYEPEAAHEGQLQLRNCPFRDVVGVARELICGLNQRLVDGVLDGLEVNELLAATLDGATPHCCVTVQRTRS